MRLFTGDERKGSIIIQVGILFAVCVVVTGILTYNSQYSFSDKYITEQTEARAERAAKEAKYALEEYPAHKWLILYWYKHADDLDIEYDVRFTSSTKTEKKSKLLQKHQPNLQLKYVSAQELSRLPEEDQKLYAEIVYSWVITRLNEVKTTHKIDYMFVILSQAPYNKQFFLLSAADPNSVRGTEYEQVYPLGVISEVGEDQQAGMEHAVRRDSHIAQAGKYVDYYSYMNTLDGQDVLIGLTYNISELIELVDAETKKRTMFAVIYQILYSFLASLGIFGLVLNPLKRVQQSIRDYKKNKDSAAVAESMSEIKLNNEIGDLASDVTSLTKEIDDYLDEIRRITSDKERMQAELSLANQIQQSMLPHVFPPFPERSEFEIYASMDPAREVGGDFYDFFMIDDDHIGMVIADVSGKGIPAALFMMVSMLILKTHALMGVRPSEVLRKSNEGICSNNQAEMFVTVWIGVLEISTGIMTAANAGHEYPVVQHAGGDFELLKDKHGLVIGAIDDAQYSDYEIRMEPGSKIFVYSDGLPEANDEENNMFGMDRIIDALNADKEVSTEQILNNMSKAVDEFVKDAEQFDDLTMLCFEYKGKE